MPPRERRSVITYNSNVQPAHSRPYQPFVNGTDDPGQAERFTPSGRDSYAYQVPHASYRTARLANLPPATRAEATAVLQRWAR